MPRKGKSGLTRISGFPPVMDKFVRVLILGSMPGNASLAKNEYYGLPHNAFWRIMGDLFGASADLPYAERLKVLTDRGIALWDVLDSCYRPGSLDSAIDDRTAKTNNFEILFRDHCTITHVFFNGKKAANLFAKRILPTIEDEQVAKTFVTLPSTSPALASMTYEEKLDQWAVVKAATG
jgi:TDG/mug DNA glycosylase family protein